MAFALGFRFGFGLGSGSGSGEGLLVREVHRVVLLVELVQPVAAQPLRVALGVLHLLRLRARARGYGLGARGYGRGPRG